MIVRTAALAAVLAMAPAAGFAAEHSVSVNYNDLDLSTAKGVAELNKRVDRAAKQVCTTHEVTTGTILPSTLDKTCYRETREKLTQQMAAIAARKQQG